MLCASSIGHWRHIRRVVALWLGRKWNVVQFKLVLLLHLVRLILLGASLTIAAVNEWHLQQYGIELSKFICKAHKWIEWRLKNYYCIVTL